MPLTREVLVLAFALAGVSLKLADVYGEREKGYVLAAVSAAIMGVLIFDSSTSSSIVLGIVLGVALAGKIDQPNLRIGLGLTLVIAAILEFTLGFNVPDPQLLAIIAAAALIDEKGHDRIASRGIVGKFFRFRMVLKITVVFLAVLMWIDVVYAVGFFCFDVSYDLVSVASPFSGEDI